MNLLDEGKALLANQEVQEGTVNFLADCGEALLGSPIAVGKIVWTITKTSLSLPDRIFWNKFQLFLEGISFKEEEQLKFCAKLAEDGESGDNPFRLIEAINRCDTKRKITYLVSASRAFASGAIDKATYFRIAQTVTNCLVEDLEFVAKNILAAKDYEYSNTVQGLLNCGLMYQSVLDENGRNKYAFTPFAKVLDLYSLSFENVDKYPNRKKTAASINYNMTPTDVRVTARFG